MKKNLSLAVLVLSLCVILTGCASHSKSGVDALKDKDYKTAVSEFNQAIKKGENVKEAYIGLGIAYFDSKEYNNAIVNFKKGIELGASTSSKVKIYLAKSYKELGNKEESNKLFEEILSDKEIKLSNKERQGIYKDLIINYEANKNYSKAKELIAKYVKEYPNDKAMKKEAELFEIE